MKINIVTMNKAYNYGAMLQAYALQQTIDKLGNESYFINININDDSRKSIKLNKYIKFNKNIASIVNNLYYFLYRNKIKEGYDNFYNFIHNEERLTKYYNNFDELKNNPPESDIYITGSDQVWNPLNIKPHYFLAFGNEKTKRISYAASMGISYIPDDKKEEFTNYIKDIDCISVRENKAKEIISKLTDKDIQVNIDPVFLIDKEKWHKIEQPVDINKPYILCYILYRPTWLNAELKKLHKRTGLDIILVDNKGYRNIYCNRMIRNAGPKEFLWLINNANKIITSSFHGTALSIVFEKDFLSIVNPNSPSRINNLLKKLDLSSRAVNNLDDINEINYTNIKERINEEKRKAIAYLKESING